MTAAPTFDTAPDNDGVRIGELLTKPGVHHARIERPSPEIRCVPGRGRGQEPITVAVNAIGSPYRKFRD
jgi:hypothetical protein